MRQIRFDIEELIIETRRNKYGTEYVYVEGICKANLSNSVGGVMCVVSVVKFHSEDNSHGISVEFSELSEVEFSYMRIHLDHMMKVLRGDLYCWMDDLVNESLVPVVEAYKMGLI